MRLPRTAERKNKKSKCKNERPRGKKQKNCFGVFSVQTKNEFAYQQAHETSTQDNHTTITTQNQHTSTQQKQTTTTITTGSNYGTRQVHPAHEPSRRR